MDRRYVELVDGVDEANRCVESIKWLPFNHGEGGRHCKALGREQSHGQSRHRVGR